MALATLIAVLAGLSYGVNDVETQSVSQVPTPVIVDGKAQNLAEGKVFLFFYDPSCMHCDAAAKFMSKLNLGRYESSCHSDSESDNGRARFSMTRVEGGDESGTRQIKEGVSVC